MFSANRMYMVPPNMQDYGFELLENTNNTLEVRANFAQRIEAIRDYCDHILQIYERSRTDSLRQKKKQRT